MAMSLMIGLSLNSMRINSFIDGGRFPGRERAHPSVSSLSS